MGILENLKEELIKLEKREKRMTELEETMRIFLFAVATFFKRDYPQIELNEMEVSAYFKRLVEIMGLENELNYEFSNLKLVKNIPIT